LPDPYIDELRAVVISERYPFGFIFQYSSSISESITSTSPFLMLGRSIWINSLRLWELFSAALCNNADEHFIGRQAGDWAMLYRQLDALMLAAWELNGAKDTNPVLLCVRG